MLPRFACGICIIRVYGIPMTFREHTPEGLSVVLARVSSGGARPPPPRLRGQFWTSI